MDRAQQLRIMTENNIGKQTKRDEKMPRNLRWISQACRIHEKTLHTLKRAAGIKKQVQEQLILVATS